MSDRKREIARAWRAAHPDYSREYLRAWLVAHPEKQAQYAARRDAKLRARPCLVCGEPCGRTGKMQYCGRLACEFGRRVAPPDTNGCRLWIGRSDRGYGRFQYTPRRYKRAHRWAWETTFGPLAAGIELHHTCGHSLCVALEHLRPVTSEEHKRLHPAKPRRRLSAVGGGN